MSQKALLRKVKAHFCEFFFKKNYQNNIHSNLQVNKDNLK